MSIAANTIPQLSDRVNQAIAELNNNDETLRGLLTSVASAASRARTSSTLAPSVKELGRFAVDELDPKHPMSGRVGEILDIYQAIVRGERRQNR